jgi:hypothetical protein
VNVICNKHNWISKYTLCPACNPQQTYSTNSSEPIYHIDNELNITKIQLENCKRKAADLERKLVAAKAALVAARDSRYSPEPSGGYSQIDNLVFEALKEIEGLSEKD